MRTWDRDKRQYVEGWAAWWAEFKIVCAGIMGLAGMIMFALIVTALGNGTWQW